MPGDRRGPDLENVFGAANDLRGLTFDFATKAWKFIIRRLEGIESVKDLVDV